MLAKNMLLTITDFAVPSFASEIDYISEIDLAISLLSALPRCALQVPSKTSLHRPSRHFNSSHDNHQTPYPLPELATYCCLSSLFNMACKLYSLNPLFLRESGSDTRLSLLSQPVRMKHMPPYISARGTSKSAIFFGDNSNVSINQFACFRRL